MYETCLCDLKKKSMNGTAHELTLSVNLHFLPQHITMTHLTPWMYCIYNTVEPGDTIQEIILSQRYR